MIVTSRLVDRAPGKRWSSPLLIALLCLPSLSSAQLPNGTVTTLAPIIEQVSPAVVNISVSGVVPVDNPLSEDPFFRRFFPETRPVQSAGSGVIVDADQGYILTNHHVVADADKITVTLLDNRSLDATVVGSDEASDVAVLKVEADDLSEIALGDSDIVRVGDFVVAIGNPFGLSHTVTSGIVSGLGRSQINPGPDAYEDFIQTDASINPGNSGGALVDMKGELIGINSAILSRSGGNIGIGFAIPVNMARNIMDQLIDYGEVSHGMLGVVINPVTPEIASMYSLKGTSGALVMSVTPNSAAEQAGLMVSDVIVSVDGEAVRDPGSLRNEIGLLRPGAHVQIGFVREGRQHTVDATLGEASSTVPAIQSFAAPEEPDVIDPVFEGAELVPNNSQRPSFDGVEGVLVASVEQGSPAAELGLLAGDVITYVNRQRVREVAEIGAIVAQASSVILQVQRGNRGLLLLMR